MFCCRVNWQQNVPGRKNASLNARRSIKHPRRFLSTEQAHIIRADPPLVMNAVEGSVYTDTSERNFRRLAAQGVFPSIRLGRRVLFRRDALDAALARLESVMKQTMPHKARPRLRGQPSKGNTNKKEIQ